MERKELVWVEAEFAELYNKATSEQTSREERLKLFNEYIETVSNESREEYKSNLKCLEEDLAIYNGLMLQVKQSFEKAKHAHLEAAVQIWSDFDKQLPDLRSKVQQITDVLKPLKNLIEDLNNSIANINTNGIDNMIDTVKQLSSLYGTSKDMIDFLVNNFTNKKE